MLWHRDRDSLFLISHSMQIANVMLSTMYKEKYAGSILTVCGSRQKSIERDLLTAVWCLVSL